MATLLYSLEVTARRRGSTKDIAITAQLDVSGTGPERTWWFAVKMNGNRLGNSKRFAFTSTDKPPFKEANAEIRQRIAASLGVPFKQVIFASPLAWRADD